MDTLKILEDWYAMQCNGDWEHTYGIIIETLDNPGWSLRVDLAGTEIAESDFEEISIERSEVDWFHCWKADSSFHGVGGYRNLQEIIKAFCRFVNATHDL